MSNLVRTCRDVYHAPIEFTLLLFIAMLIPGCGGDVSNTTDSTNPTQSTTSNSATIVLKADAGAVCETLLTGEVYTRTLPPLSCNNGTDPYTAYLDGSRSSASGGESLSYAWSFVSKPTGSQAKLMDADTAKPTFVPDRAGSYAVQLIVSALGVSSPRAVALVIALDNTILNPDTISNPAAMGYRFHGGLSSNCSVCHSGADPALPGKSSTHIATSNMCQTCHSPTGFSVTSFFDHKEVFGNCSDCHDGIIATGKSAAHLVTTQECGDCHTTTSFVTLSEDGTFDHSHITEPCSACHNGTTAIGTNADPNPTGHPSTSAECNSCHTTETFGTPFPNHSDPAVVVPDTCGQAGCHDGNSVANGVAIPGKNSAPYPHPSTGDITQACDLCHNTTSFNMGGLFDHGVLARHPIACKSCHDGLNATGKIAGHISTVSASDCGNCHNTSTFVGGFVDHASDPTVTTPGVQCTDCHDGTHTWSFIDSTGATVTLDIPGAPTNPPFPPTLADIHTAAAGQSCSDCHTAGGSFALATVDHSGFTSNTVCSDCHDGTTATGKPDGHLATTEECGACHNPQSDNWIGAGFDHSSLSIVGTNSTPTCTSCHDGTAAIGQSLTHVPLPTTEQDCLVCHGTDFTSFALPTFDHTAAGITNNCVSCHDGRTHDAVIVITTPAGHISTASVDCSTCHADTTNGPGINGSITSGFTRADPFLNTVHPAYTTGCRTCHNGSYDNAIYNAKSHPTDSVHATVDSNNWDCNACHTTRGNFAETNPVNHQDPAIKTEACVSCHVAGRTVSPIGKGPTHPTTSDICQNCHQAGGSFTAGFDHMTLDTGGINFGLACATCHDGINATGKTPNHVPTRRDCIDCHAGYPPAASSFTGGTFDHSGPEMNGKLCMDCHNGDVATGKSSTHIATNQDCGACHTTVTFAGAASFDHTGVVDGCQNSGCHSAGNPTVTDVTDDPNPLPHIPIVKAGMEINCYSCHKNPGATFANASMDHSVVTFEGCQSCHDGNHDGSNAAHIVTTKSSSHFVTLITACTTCHTSTTTWTAISYKHTTGGGYPGDHSTTRVTSCTQCHSNTPANANISTFPHSTYGSTCAACHASKGTREHGNPLPTKYYNCGNSGCHRVNSSRF
jgi:hypothetical protein